MGKDITKLLTRSPYPFSVFLAVLHYVFFASGPTPGFWEKILMMLICVFIIIFYSLAKFSAPGRKDFGFLKEGPLKIPLVSLAVVIATAVFQYFVLIIFFWKNPPVSVGIPYTIYSFSAGKLIVPGLIYNWVFFIGTNLFLAKIKR